MKKILVLCSLLCGLGNSAFGAYYSGFPMCKTHGAQPNSIIAFDCGADSDAEFPSLDELKHMRVEDVILCNWRSGGLEKVFDLLQDRCDLKMIRISDCNISNRELDALLRLLDANQYIKGVFSCFPAK